MRARINDRLARAARFPVALLVAPAGFGKSVALRDYLETSRVDAVRFDVGREVTTLEAFARGLSDALAAVAPGARASFPALQERLATEPQPARIAAAWFAEHLQRTVCTIVVDDFQHAAGPAVVALLVELVERTMGRISWIIATRSDAGLPVASWMGYGRMDVPVGEDDLRFTLEEAMASAEDGAAPAAPDVRALHALTDGWPIALGIALRMRLHAADLAGATSGTREMISRYLAEQVFAGLDRTQQRFLLDTSVYAALDDEVLVAYGADAAFLDELRRTVTFLTPVRAGVYRYHDLFRDFLERELRRAGAHAWHDAHLRAAQLLEARGDAAQALTLFASIGEAAGVLRVLERSGLALLEHGEADRLVSALAAVPDASRTERAAVLGLEAALEARRGRFDAAEPLFAAAIARAAEPERRLALVHRYAIELVRNGRDAIALLEAYANDCSVPVAARALLLGTLATAYVGARRLADAQTAIDAALVAGATLGGDVRARLWQQAAYVASFAGDVARTRDYGNRAVEAAVEHGLYEVAARACSALYTVAFEDDDPIATLAVLDRLGEYARKSASRSVQLYGLVAAYEVEIERGDEAAIAALDAALADVDAAPSGTRNEALLPAQAMRAAWEGDFARAYALLDGTVDAQTNDERRALRAAEVALYATAAGERDAGEAALGVWSDALERVRAPGRRAARSRVVAALTELLRGRTPAAQRRLAEAEAALAPQQHRLRALVQAGRAIALVQLGQAEAAAVGVALERLRAVHGGGFARLLAALPFPEVADQSGYTRLTPAEREILQLLARGASTKDVAAYTGRSPQTVDTHIRSICRKLRCSGRREAVAVATTAGWVRP
ncbi:MAG TPA: LuxR C-terminal-related transcriptional regulator [Candidatus Sulfotelmatobacter sp.]|nr:LuxR C-terminal-related transcriptional regulator [Candidatus Sulfotelmatobacter sp.]